MSPIPDARDAPRPDGLALATGSAAFADDAPLPGALHAALLRATRPHARATRLDASRARALPGVACVLLPEDAPELLRAEPLFEGDRVAAVAAEDPELARRAVEAIEAEWSELPARLEADPEAPPVFEREAGDVAGALAAAERVVETRLAVPPRRQATLEPRACACWLGEDGRLTVRSSTPAPFRLRRSLAARLGLAAGAIRVLATRTTHAAPELLAEDLCALLALRTRRAVRLSLRPRDAGGLWRLSGAEAITVRSGLVQSRLVALDVAAVAEVGAREPETLPDWPAPLALYAVPNRRCVLRAGRTHRPPAGGAGFGVTLAVEAHLAAVAEALGEDPAELRRLVAGDGAGRVLAALAPADRSGPRRRAPEAMRRGVGLAVAVGVAPPAGTATAALRRNEDGSFHLSVGATAPGDAAAALGRVAAELLGAAPGAVHFASPDTDASPAADDAPCLTTAARAVEAAARTLSARAGRPSALESAGPATGTPAVAAAAAEVELDPATGVVRVASLRVAVDCGRALDVAATEDRVHGAAVRAVGLVLEAEGAPAATDLPESAAVLVPGEGGAGPFGSKDLGGAPDAAAAAALVNAVARAAGGRIEALPATPERVLLALDAQRDGSR